MKTLDRRYIIKTFSMYDLEENQELLKQARIIAARDGWSFSELVVESLKEYVVRHGEGNPQTKLEYASQPKTLPRWKTCVESKKQIRKGEIFCLSHGLWLNTWICKERCDRYREDIVGLKRKS